MTGALLVVLGAAVGAPLRYLVGRWANRTFPTGTLLVNVAGSAVLGLLAGVGTALPQPVFTLVGTGFCGALTTYSTFGWETVHLARRGGWLVAAGNVVLSLAGGVGAAWLGHALVA